MLGCVLLGGVNVRSVNVWGKEGEGGEVTGCERKVKVSKRVQGMGCEGRVCAR